MVLKMFKKIFILYYIGFLVTLWGVMLGPVFSGVSSHEIDVLSERFYKPFFSIIISFPVVFVSFMVIRAKTIQSYLIKKSLASVESGAKFPPAILTKGVFAFLFLAAVIVFMIGLILHGLWSYDDTYRGPYGPISVPELH